MKTISLRGIDEVMAQRLKEQAAQAGKSVNQYLVDLIRKATGLDKPQRFTATHRDLDQLFGQWSEAEFEAIQGKIDAEQQVDPELWS